VDGVQEPARFHHLFGGLIARAAETRRVRVFGEMVAILAAEGDHAGARALEGLWNGLQRSFPFSLLCAYPMHVFGQAALAESFGLLCAEHEDVTPTEAWDDSASPDDRLLAITQLQQKAASLEAEVAERQRAEEALRDEIRVNEIIQQVGLTLAAELDLQRLVQAVTDAGTELTDAEVGAFFYDVVDERGESATLYAVCGAPRDAFSQFPTPARTALFAPTFAGEGAIRSDDVTKDPRYGHHAPHFGMPTGHVRVVSYLAVPVVSRSGDVLGRLIFGHSRPGVFTARAERLVVGLAAQTAVAIDNARLYEAAKRALAARDEFLSLAAHELKTPITTVRGFAQLTIRRLGREGTPDPDRIRQALEVIDLQADRLSRLVSQLLDIRRIETGQLVLERSEVDVARLVEALVETFRVAAPHRAIRLRSPDSVGASVDALRLEQVVTNLLDNADKYSPPDTTIEVDLSMPGPQRLRIAVVDRGPGVRREDRERIFDRFHRLEPAQHAAGMGLGLYVSREIVRLHDGAITVEDHPEGGCCFTVELPAH
jgi:signal transduction histidine kinase